MPKPGEELPFTKKVFIYEDSLGSGGTGETLLVKDITTDMKFAIKKYVPYDEQYRDEFYKRFVDEIKILFLLSHPNIVRIYNYYLYPEQKTGYIQMEYVKGMSIEDHFIFRNSNFDETFLQIIDAFTHLEANGILHRDVRPANILITDDDVVKIIDFGFGKKLEENVNGGQSVMLNWPVTELPNELTKSNPIYTHASEVYFVGKMFNKLLSDYGKNEEFQYHDILHKMVQGNPDVRYKSFSTIKEDISIKVFDNEFTQNDKSIYRIFASDLMSHIVRLNSEFKPHYDVLYILNKMESLLRESSLEEYIQNNDRLISCFVRGSYRFSQKRDIEVEGVKLFYDLFRSKPPGAQRVILDNLYSRFYSLKVGIEDDLPF